ncbi:MAG TPA: carboxypeptidase-like regulatory domain-containing protein, partial [Terriglobia bacterium]|nr:carboxypeptidase-like regulatory domain-containing protein [Terriglobia bacterium]
MKLKFSFLAAFALLLASFTSSILRAQAVGEITGTVTDPTGAVVPDVSVTATNVATGVSQTTLSTAAGTYTLARLLVGTYDVTAEAKGLKKGRASGITLDVSQQRELNFTLAIGEVTSTVEVSAAPPLLNTTNATLANVVSSEQVENLPL